MRGNSRLEVAPAGDGSGVAEREFFIDGTCLVLVGWLSGVSGRTWNPAASVVGNLETTLLENIFHINLF